jgi:EmrB/QacA subfamily drug resistance transporter
MCSALFLLGLDYTVLNVAIPGLQHDLGPSLAQTQWIVDGYALVLGGCVLAAGALGDTYGRRRAFLGGLAVCLLASVAGATGHSAAQLVAGRCGMGLGAALFMPATLSTIVHVFSDAAKRRKAIAIWAAVAGIGVLAGPVLGGWLVEQYGWRAAFWLNVPVAAVMMTAGALLVPESRNPRPERLDRIGAVLSGGGLLSLVWGVIEAPGRGWTSGPVLAAFTGAVVLLAAFVCWEVGCGTPLVPVALFRRGPVGPASLSLAVMSFGMFGAMFLLTLYFQEVRGLSAWAAGVRMIPLSVGLASGAGTSPLLGRRFGARLPVAVGLLLIAAGFTCLTRLRTGSGDGPVLVFQALAGFGSGLLAPAATETVMRAVPAATAGVGSALNDATRQVGSTLGVAVFGSVLSTVFTSRVGSRVGPSVFAHTDVAAVGRSLDQSRAAFTDGLAACAWVGGATALLGGAMAWFSLPPSRADTSVRHTGPDDFGSAGHGSGVSAWPVTTARPISRPSDSISRSTHMPSPIRARLRALLTGRSCNPLMKHPLESWRVPTPDGRYTPGEGDPLRLTLLGDSLARGLGALTPRDTLGAHLADGLAQGTGRPVDLEVLARVGATTKGVQRQVARAVTRSPGIAVIIVGANDAMLPLPISWTARRFGKALDDLGGAGWKLVVVPCPDLGRTPGLRSLVRLLAAPRARRLARLQERAALEVQAVIAPSSVEKFLVRPTELLSSDGLHPSPLGYAFQAARMLPSLIAVARRFEESAPGVQEASEHGTR